ncbi:MAG: COX15/CtaA family protein [Rhodospirillales bacterium]
MARTDTDKQSRERIIGLWLLLMGGMVILMVVLGGLTRLTNSGLSMVEWRPITGWLPPLSHAAWEDAFAAYRAFPEYQKLNVGMTLAGSRGSTGWNTSTGLWGRLIGVAFALPLIFFLARRWGRPGARLEAVRPVRAGRPAGRAGLVHGEERAGGPAGMSSVPAWWRTWGWRW